jgi:hypothetical protein
MYHYLRITFGLYLGELALLLLCWLPRGASRRFVHAQCPGIDGNGTFRTPFVKYVS